MTSANRELIDRFGRQYILTILASLIIFFSKSLLRHPLVKSDLKDMAPGSTFQRYIPDPHPESLDAPENIKRHIVSLPSVSIYMLLL